MLGFLYWYIIPSVELTIYSYRIKFSICDFQRKYDVVPFQMVHMLVLDFGARQILYLESLWADPNDFHPHWYDFPKLKIKF